LGLNGGHYYTKGHANNIAILINRKFPSLEVTQSTGKARKRERSRGWKQTLLKQMKEA
jgi:hypothetical protein